MPPSVLDQAVTDVLRRGLAGGFLIQADAHEHRIMDQDGLLGEGCEEPAEGADAGFDIVLIVHPLDQVRKALPIRMYCMATELTEG